MAAGWIAGLAILALMATGWRKTARAASDSARGGGPGDGAVGVEVVEVDAPIDRPTSVARRIGAAALGGVMAVSLGAVIATVVGFGVAYGVITLTHMLKR